MFKKVHVLFVSLLLAWAVTLGFTSCSDLNSVDTTTQTESITLTSRTSSTDQNKLELIVAFANFSTAPATVDVYLEGQESPLFSNVAVTNGKISIDLSNLQEGTYKLYVKSGDISSNVISITLTEKSGIITISTGEAKGTEKAASAVIHFKQSKDGNTYEVDNIEKKIVPEGSTIESLAKTYTGFTAQGLFLAEQTDGTYVVNIYYTRNIISVTLNGNGGSIGGQESTVIKGLYGADFPLAKSLNITHETKVFDCWNTKADGNGSDYKDATGFTFTEDITLYAKWLDYYDLTVAETAEKIESLGSGSYTIKVSGAITDSDIEAIKNAMLTNQERYIALDLSKTSGLTKLGKEAFTNKKKSKGAPLLSLVLPESVTELGDYCLYYCGEITTLIAPGVRTVKEWALYRCKKLSQLTLANELDSIEYVAFGYCFGLSELNLNAKNIGVNIAAGNHELKTIIIGPAVENISNGAFQDLETLEKFIVSENNTNFKSVNDILYSFDQTRLIHYPNGCEAKEFTLPNTVTTIDEYAFSYCKNLEKVTLSNVLIIPSKAFYYAQSIKEISIQKTISINSMAFYRCKNLQTITLPNTLTEIGMFAFAYDSNLSSIFIPSSVETIEDDAFKEGNKNLIINCEATCKPSGWNTNWARYNSTAGDLTNINWGATRN